MQVAEMPVAEAKTKTVRVPVELANMLQTIASLKEEMGERFRSVEYLTGLLDKPIRTLHAETVRKYWERPGAGKARPKP
jgi:NTP pyrophosphatase (non-canonical NTP hydrolase)